MMKGNNKTRSLAAALLLASALVATSACGGGEARKAQHVEQGQKLMAERNFQKARIEFRNAQQIDPKDAGVRSLVGYTSEKLGEYDDAVKAYRLALSTDETLVMPRARLARILAVAGLDDEATELVTKGLELVPQSPELLSVRAVIRQQQGDVAAARQDAEQAYASAPADPDILATLAAIRWSAGERDEAIAIVRKGSDTRPDDPDLRLLHARLQLAMERYADAERELVEVVRLVPSNLEFRNLLAQVYLQQGKADQAIQVARDAVAVNPDSAEGKLILARLLAAHRSFDEAMGELEGFRKAAPKDQELSLAVADFYAAGGRTEQAESIYRELIDSASTPARGFAARNRLARLEVGRGRIDEGARLAGEVLAENPSDTNALVTRAEVALRKGDAAAAVTDLRVAFSAQPDSVPVAVALARAYLSAGQGELAEQALRSVIQTSPRSVEARFALAQFLIETGRERQAQSVVEQLVSEQSGNLLALAALARLQAAGGDPAAALKTARTLKSLQPKSALGYVAEGEALRAQENVDAARKAYEQALVWDPEAVEPVLALTRLDVSAGKLDAALERLDARLAKYPSQPLLHALRGDVLMTMQRSSDAALAYSAAVKLRPGSVQPHRGLAAALITMKQTDKAAEALQSGLKATGGSRQLAVDLANLYTQTDRVDDAVAVYEAALRRSPNDNVLANNLAMLLVNERSDAASLGRAEQLVERFATSENAIFLDSYGWVAYKRGRYPEALAALEKAVAKAPSAAELRYHLGMTQLKLGRAEEARVNLETAVMAGPRYPGFDEARKALEST